MPEQTSFKETDNSTISVSTEGYRVVTEDQIADPVTKPSSAWFDLSPVDTRLVCVELKDVRPFGSTITYSMGAAATDKNRSIKMANELLSEGVDFDLDLTY